MTRDKQTRTDQNRIESNRIEPDATDRRGGRDRTDRADRARLITDE